MDEKSESNSRLAKALEVNRAQNIKCIKEMIQDNEKKVRDIIQENDLNIRDLLTTQDEKATERDERVEERLMNMEKMIRTLAQQRNNEGRRKDRTVTRSTRNIRVRSLSASKKGAKITQDQGGSQGSTAGRRL